LQRPVCNRDGEVSLAASRLAFEDDRAAFGDEVWREQRADGREPQRGLVAEVELFDGPQERKLRCAKRPVHARGTPVRHFFGEQRLQQLLVAPLFLLGARDQAAPRTATVRQVKALEQRVEVRAHCSPRRRTRVSVS
jgi:hypothetical protein